MTLFGHIRAAFKLTVFVVLCVLLIPVQALAFVLTKGQGAFFYAVPRGFHTLICALFEVKIHLRGDISNAAHTLFIANHLSYIDIIVLGSLLPASFIAKTDVARWPLFGLLAKLQNTFFINRTRRRAAREINAFQNRLANNKSNLILFAEGTSSDGRKVLPFKSSLFQVLEKDPPHDLTVQPVTLHLKSVDRQSADDQKIRDLYCWYGDMTLPDHLWRFAGGRGAELEIIFHAEQPVPAGKTRKELAAIYTQTVQDGLQSFE